MLSIWTLSGHGLWISGLALLLTMGSSRSWRRANHPQRLDEPPMWPVLLGQLLVTSGLLLVSTTVLEWSIWGVSTLLLAGMLGRSCWNAERARRLWALPQTRWLLGTLVSGGALYLAFRGVDYRSVGTTLLQANGTLILLALLSVVLNNIIKAIRWRVLIGEQGKPILLRELLRVLLISQMLNLIIPARVGELSRAYMIGRQGPGSAFILGTVALEKLIDTVLYLILLVGLIVLMPVPAWLSQPIYPFALLTFSGLLIVLLLGRYQAKLLGLLTRVLRWLGWLPPHLQARITRLVSSALDSLAILKDWRTTLAVSWWSALVWVTAVLNNYLVLLALGIVAPPPAALLVSAVLQAGIAIPSVPGKLGVFQYLCILALDVFAIDRTLALSYGVLLQAITFLPITIGGIGLLWASGFTVRGSAIMPVSDAPEPLPPRTID